jgi:hypothetical protein
MEPVLDQLKEMILRSIEDYFAPERDYEEDDIEGLVEHIAKEAMKICKVEDK